jgi:hypothetical protein
MRVLIATFLLFYVCTYGIYRQTQQEVWIKDKTAYVMFPANFAGRTLYYFFRPLIGIDAAATGMHFHIGPHR